MINSLFQEKLGDAFLMAVAAMAQCTCGKPSPDIYGIDWELAGRPAGTILEYVSLHVQVKTCLRRNLRHQDDSITYDLDAHNYNQLVAPVMVPRMLVLVELADLQTSWLMPTNEELLLRHAAYFRVFKEAKPTSHTSSIAVTLEKRNHLTPGNLMALMRDAGNRML